jgi:hypothetical protein
MPTATLALTVLIASASLAPPTEGDYWRIETLAVPDTICMEVTGLLQLDERRLMASTRRGEIWIVTDPWGEKPEFKLAYDGLSEPLGLLAPKGWKGPTDWIYTSQRGELSRIRDDDGDGTIDRLETVSAAWGISGNYHEYCFGPAQDANGDLWLTLNRPFGEEPFGPKDWRGWAVRIAADGSATFECAGLRSPCGVEASPEGEIFYTDNQGEWCPTNKLSHLSRGEFHGHPWGIASAKRAESKVSYPGDVEQIAKSGLLMPEAMRLIPNLKLPAIWFPYDKMGKSAAGFVWDTTGGKFGPFTGQVFVTDQHHASVMRVSLERVDGAWQGACYPFRSGFQCGIIRCAWLSDGSLIVGQTNRGWGSRGQKPWGIERAVWTGEVPFEIHTMSATPQGFRLRFTKPVDPASASNPASYAMTSYTYELHEAYGSPEMDTKPCTIAKATVAPDGLTVDLTVEGLRAMYVHELVSAGLRSADGLPLLHPDAYYTLNRIPK